MNYYLSNYTVLENDLKLFMIQFDSFKQHLFAEISHSEIMEYFMRQKTTCNSNNHILKPCYTIYLYLFIVHNAQFAFSMLLLIQVFQRRQIEV